MSDWNNFDAPIGSGGCVCCVGPNIQATLEFLGGGASYGPNPSFDDTELHAEYSGHQTSVFTDRDIALAAAEAADIWTAVYDVPDTVDSRPSPPVSGPYDTSEVVALSTGGATWKLGMRAQTNHYRLTLFSSSPAGIAVMAWQQVQRITTTNLGTGVIENTDTIILDGKTNMVSDGVTEVNFDLPNMPAITTWPVLPPGSDLVWTTNLYAISYFYKFLRVLS